MDNKDGLYLYSKTKKLLVNTNDYIVIDKDEVMSLEIIHASDIKSSFGRVDVDQDTFKPYFKYNTVIISVSKESNDFAKVDRIIEENEYIYCRVVSQKKFTEIDNARRTGSMVKYFGDNEDNDLNFHVFTNKLDHDYNPKDNSLVFNLDKYKKLVLDKVKNSNDTIRQHGYYYKFWEDGPEFIQPFRKGNMNDLHIIENLRNNIPAELRQLFFFKEDAETGLRREDKWVWSGPIVRTEILSVIIRLISAYDAGLSAAINDTLTILNNETKLEKLQYFDLHHVKIILRELQKQIENMPIFKDTMVQFRTMLKEYKITPPTVHRLEDGTEEFKEA